MHKSASEDLMKSIIKEFLLKSSGRGLKFRYKRQMDIQNSLLWVNHTYTNKYTVNVLTNKKTFVNEN